MRPLTPVSTAAIVFHPPQPPPGSTNPPSAYLGIAVSAPAPIKSFALTLDGQPVTPEIGGRDQKHQAAFYQPARWSAGSHTAVATVVLTTGQSRSYAWSFTIR